MSEIAAERRAEAAERTVEVLKRKVIELYNGVGSSLHRQLEGSRRREEQARIKRELSEVREAELQRYSETLELEVARRTEAIKVILDNVLFGFLVVGRDLVVQAECTRSCQRLFAAERVAGESLCDLLRLSGRARQELILGVDQVFEDILPTEVSLAQIRHKFPMANGRILHVEGSVVRGATAEIGSLLFTVSDITALEAATRESNHNRTLVGILRQKESFRSFVLDSKQQLATALRALAEPGAGPPAQAVVRHAIHTVKGNSASYALNDIVELIHHIEDSEHLVAAQIEAIDAALRAFLDTNQEILGLDYGHIGEEGFEITREQMSGLRSLIAAVPDEGAEGLRRWTSGMLKRPAWQLLGPIEDFSRKLADRLGKSITFELTGADTCVDVEAMRPVAHVISHVVRNAIDHGIEGPLHRHGKPRQGRVHLDIADRDGSYVLRCEDDGGGIHLDVLAERAVGLGLLPRARVQAMSDDEKLNLVFVDGLSSAEVTTSISGRGVGMSAVKAAVEKVGGRVEIQSARHRGTVVSLVIPKSTTDASGDGPSDPQRGSTARSERASA